MKTLVGTNTNGWNRTGLVARLSDRHTITAPSTEVMAQHLRMLGISREEIALSQSDDGDHAMSTKDQATFWEAWERRAPSLPRNLEIEGDSETSWDVTIAIRDVSLDISRHTMSCTVPDQQQLREWLQWLNLAARLHFRLESACEDLVEEGSSPERLAAMEQALAHAQGQAGYCYRRDRW